MTPEPGRVQRPDVLTVQHDHSTARVIEALEQRRHGGFTCGAAQRQNVSIAT